MTKHLKLSEEAPVDVTLASSECALLNAQKNLSDVIARQHDNELAIEAAQARVQEYKWGAPKDDPRREGERAAKDNFNRFVNDRVILSRRVRECRTIVDRCEARLMLTRTAGHCAEALRASDAAYANATRLVEDANRRRDEAAAALASAQNRRQQCVAAAARGEASSAKNLKVASGERDDAADVLAVAEAVLEEAQRQATECEVDIHDGLARGLAIAAADIGEERAAISAKMGKLFGELIDCLQDFETKGREAHRFVVAARNVPHRQAALSVGLDAALSRSAPDVRQFLRFLYGRMPNEVRNEIAQGNLSPSTAIEDLEAIERKIWSALRAA